MRVLVAADAMAGLDPRGASEVIATAFAETGAQVAVIPLADGGAAFADAVAQLEPVDVVTEPRSLSETLEVLSRPVKNPGERSTLWVDLTALESPAWSELTAVRRSDLDEMAAGLNQRDIVAIVKTGEQTTTLTGLSGRLAERGREEGLDLAQTLASNDAVAQWLASVGVDDATPGSGAADGVGAIILSLGGRVLSGIEALIQSFDMESSVARADLLVTGSHILDFHAVGGDVVKEVARLGTEASRPVIAIVGRNYVSARELRVAGIESAHAILEGIGADEAVPAQLAQVAGKVATSWSW